MLAETVNPANGSVSLRIDTPTTKGRGITLPFSFAYDSNGVNHLAPGGINAGPASDVSYASQGGWAYSIPLIRETAYSTTSCQFQNCVTCNFSSGYTFQDPTGGRHALGLGASTFAIGGNYLCANPVSGGGDAKYAASLIDPAPYANVNPPLQITDADGTVYYFPNPEQFFINGQTSGIPNYIEDRNGNKISISPGSKTGSFTITDTAGRASISSNGLGASGTTNTVSVSGLNYKVAWTSTTPNFSFPFKVAWIAPGSYTCGSFVAATGAETVVSSITLPNGKQYKFYYGTNNPNGYSNTYGLLSEIDYPSGAWVRYTWKMSDQYSEGIVYDSQAVGGGQGIQTGCQFEVKIPVVSTRTVGFGPGSSAALTQTFKYTTAWNSDTGGGPSWSTKTTTVSTTDNIRGLTTQTVYTYSPTGNVGSNNPYLPDYMASQLPLEKTIKYYNWGNTTTPFRTVGKTWADLYDLASETTILDNGEESETTYAYTVGGLPQLKTQTEYDYGLNAIGSQLRKSVWSYQPFATTPVGGIIADKPSSVVTYDGSNNPIAETDYSYDSYLNGIGPVLATNHDDTYFGTTFTGRGNLTSKTEKCFSGSTTCTDSVTAFTFDETGQVLSMTDPCNSTCADVTGSSHKTTYSYKDSYSSGTPSGQTNTYLTTKTDALGHASTFTYGYNDGQLTSSKDSNGQPTNYKYNTPPPSCSYPDSLDRLSEIDYPDNGITTYCYNDAALSITTNKLIASAVNLSTTMTMDGMGHVVQNQLTSDPGGTTFTDTTYDGLGQKASVSNPYRSTSDPTYGITGYNYDALGRVVQITNPDSSSLLTTYTGRAVEVQDEGNGSSKVARISQTDGLGRLISVCEVTSSTQFGGGSPAACKQDIAANGFITSYSYDALENLTSVQQGSRLRSFAYDSLSRLLCAANPETGGSAACPSPDNGSYTAGTTRYAYDANGNLASRIRPAPNQTISSKTVTTSYTYDALNRSTQITYSDSTTPSVSRHYDTTLELGRGLNNTIGRLSAEYVTSSTGTLLSGKLYGYDPMGRVNDNSQCTPSRCSTASAITYSYDLVGDILSSSNGQGTAFTYSHDGAARLTTLSSTLSDANHPATLFSNGTYNPIGSLAGASLGAALNEAFAYDCRGRFLGYASVVFPTVPSLSIPNTSGCSNATATDRRVGGDIVFPSLTRDLVARDLMLSPIGTIPVEPPDPAGLVNRIATVGGEKR
jgi:YD repeat-containing protein